MNDYVTPPIGLLLGGVDFRGLAITLKEATASSPTVTLNYGTFIQTVIDFTIIAFAIFMAIKAMNTLKRREPPPAVEEPAPSREEILLTEIRDLLRQR